MKTKDEIRKGVFAKLSRMTAEEHRVLDRAITARFIQSPEYKNAHSIFIYYSAFSEVDTTSIILYCFADGKEVYLPRVEGEEMRLVRYTPGKKLHVGDFGVKEPKGEPSDVVPDLAVIPLVAFDRNHGRLGRGKGYYDRFLASYPGKSIALAYACQFVSEVPMDPTDRRPDVILCEKGRLK